MQLLTASATALAQAIKAKEITAVEVVDAHISHMEAVNPALGAVVWTRFDAAREEARRADQLVAKRSARADLPPLLGVPCTIKESFKIKGMPNTSGLMSRAGYTPTEDAITVARLRSAGAIPLGVSNLSELCMWYESDNRVWGRSRNPYDPRHIVGGSSGGEGAIVGSGASPFGLGADIGGSIRMPAFFNGVFGHKPSSGRVPNEGQHPIAEGDALRYLCTGPLCRRAEDLWPLLRILEGAPGGDGHLSDEARAPQAHDDLSWLTVVDIPEGPTLTLAPELQQTQREVVEALRSRGARVVRCSFPSLKGAAEMWSALLDIADGTPFRTLLGAGTPIPLVTELLRVLLSRSRHTLPAVVLAAVEKAPRLALKRRDRMAAQAMALKEELTQAMGQGGVMILPSHPRPAPRHGQPLLLPFSFACTALLNILEMPATQVPTGLSRRGLPLGVQVAAAHGQDARTVAVARALEEDLGGWVPPGLSTW